MKSWKRSEEMKARYLGETDPVGLQKGEIYPVLEISSQLNWFRIKTEYDDDDGSGVPGYLYPPELFEVVEEE